MHASDTVNAVYGHRLVWVYDYATVGNILVVAPKACVEVLSLLA